MEDRIIERVKEIHAKLRTMSQVWARKEPFDENEASALRREAIKLNHQRYFDLMPAYRQLAEEVGAPKDPDINFIASELVSTDDLFKSYIPEWLDNLDFEKMNKWLESIYQDKVEAPVGGLNSIDAWMQKLDERGIHNAFSSGTTGRISFVPRDEYNWDSFLNNSLNYLIFFLMEMGLSLTDKFDVASLSFKGGNMGIGIVGQRLSKFAQQSYFLYERNISVDALRIMRRGPANEREEKIIADFRETIKSGLGESYERILRKIAETASTGRQVLVFGAPFQMKELCELIISTGRNMKLPPKSAVIFGGGWKTFEGEKIERSQLVNMIGETFGVSEDFIAEGFSMTEMNMALMRCKEGRFHLPPLSEPMIFDEALLPKEGNDLTGIFGFLDPFATSYPGFIITGDNVHLVKGKCPCGLVGPAMVGEVTRAAGREVKGCGGIMGEMRA